MQVQCLQSKNSKMKKPKNIFLKQIRIDTVFESNDRPSFFYFYKICVY